MFFKYCCLSKTLQRYEKFLNFPNVFFSNSLVLFLHKDMQSFWNIKIFVPINKYIDVQKK